ncbi:ABC transporter permease [Roseospira marina]|uniref:ABC transporter permease n=1 Tax=Roseospira marina TaxID=140057 RepID=A0A5M6IE34_9PROT|nr:ABC transporter permease [Roseospira marina]KAA5606503.1 ABC transporter permease [Roseospira marina]MBB4314074.1 peptide/nickel transport system permease protein [Roseospira marina]MBB5087235.1 peptide/nickel transport system permease protein [Roseospira marina]
MSRLSAVLGSDFVYRFRRDPIAIVAFAVTAAFMLAALLAPVLSPMNPHDPAQLDIMNSEIPPVWQSGGDPAFLLGTDDQGRDMLSAILYGLRISITIGIFAVMVQMALGIVIGLMSGYLGGKVDAFFMRLADIQLAMSTLMLAIVALAVFKAAFGAELFSDMAIIMLVLVIGIAEWPQYARTIRASVLAERKKEYVDAARVIGLSAPTIMRRHILPNTLSPLLVISTVQVANAIISEAALSFLGLGMPVTMPSLGSLISAGFAYIFSGSWWITTIPSIVLIVLILSINLLGDWLRDVLNPRLYKG